MCVCTRIFYTIGNTVCILYNYHNYKIQLCHFVRLTRLKGKISVLGNMHVRWLNLSRTNRMNIKLIVTGERRQENEMVATRRQNGGGYYYPK